MLHILQVILEIVLLAVLLVCLSPSKKMMNVVLLQTRGGLVQNKRKFRITSVPSGADNDKCYHVFGTNIINNLLKYRRDYED